METLAQCEGCQKPWDKFRGKRRCPTCGVPSLVCKECLDRDADKTDSFNLKEVQCDLCVEENITSMAQVKEKERREMKDYEENHKLMPFEKDKLERLGGQNANNGSNERPNKKARSTGGDRSDPFPLTTNVRPGKNKGDVTRLWIGNLDVQNVTSEMLSKAIPDIKFVQWMCDGEGNFKGFCWVEMKDSEAASMAFAAGRAARQLCGRAIKVNYDPDTKGRWPPPNAEFLNGYSKDSK